MKLIKSQQMQMAKSDCKHIKYWVGKDGFYISMRLDEIESGEEAICFYCEKPMTDGNVDHLINSLHRMVEKFKEQD